MSETTKKHSATSTIAGGFRAIAGKPHPKNFTSVVICAAGSSTRMGGDTTKQFLELDGKPVIVHTLLAYEAAGCIQEIIVVAKADEVALYEDLAAQYGITKLTKVIPGGKTRQESARLGSDEVDKACKYIAVADGARCLITPEEIQKVCHGAYLWGAASAGIPATDTVKIVDKNNFIESTPNRNMVWLAQTPQVFALSLYRAAAYVCRDEGIEATDDNAMAEHIKVPVKMIPCSRENIKITQPGDLVFAKAVLEARKAATTTTGDNT